MNELIPLSVVDQNLTAIYEATSMGPPNESKAEAEQHLYDNMVPDPLKCCASTIYCPRPFLYNGIVLIPLFKAAIATNLVDALQSTHRFWHSHQNKLLSQDIPKFNLHLMAACKGVGEN